MKDKAYYYCYRRIIEDYAGQVEQLAKANVVQQICAYCHKTIFGPATYHVPRADEINIAGAMVDHLKQCDVVVEHSEKVKLAL